MLKRPALGAVIAAIATQWTVVEDYLGDLLGGSFGRVRPAKMDDETVGWRISPNNVLREVLAATETMRQRFKIMDATLGKLVVGTSVASSWERLQRDLKGRANERNKMVHGRWACSDTYPDDLILDEGVQLLRYRLNDLAEVYARVGETYFQVFKFSTEIHAAIESGEIKPQPFGPALGSD